MKTPLAAMVALVCGGAVGYLVGVELTYRGWRRSYDGLLEHAHRQAREIERLERGASGGRGDPGRYITDDDIAEIRLEAERRRAVRQSDGDVYTPPPIVGT